MGFDVKLDQFLEPVMLMNLIFLGLGASALWLCHVELCRENTGLGQNDYLYLYGACHYGRHLGADSAREDDEGDDMRNLFNIIRPVFIRGQEKEREEKLKWIRKETSLCSVRGVFLLIQAQFFINLQINI